MPSPVHGPPTIQQRCSPGFLSAKVTQPPLRLVISVSSLHIQAASPAPPRLLTVSLFYLSSIACFSRPRKCALPLGALRCVHSGHAPLKLSVFAASRSALASIKAPYHSSITRKSHLATHLSMGTNSDSSSPFSLAHMDAAALGSFLSSASSPLYPSTGSSALSETSGLDDSPPSDLSPEHAACASRSSSESPVRTGTSAGRKRVRPKIDLAPGQPPTARGNPRIRVFVACRQW